MMWLFVSHYLWKIFMRTFFISDTPSPSLPHPLPELKKKRGFFQNIYTTKSTWPASFSPRISTMPSPSGKICVRMRHMSRRILASYFWPRSMSFGKRCSQEVVCFQGNDCTVLVYIVTVGLRILDDWWISLIFDFFHRKTFRVFLHDIFARFLS